MVYIDEDAFSAGSPLPASWATDITALARRQYVSGWRWGVVCGLTCGVCSTALGSLLIYTVWHAL